MTKEYDVFVVGDYCLDLIFTGLPSKPILGKEIIGSGFSMTTGGSCNSVIALHRLGLKVGWAADFGSDEFSQFVLSKLRSEKIDDSLFVHHKCSMRFITVSLSYPKDRAFIAYYDPDVILPAAIKAITKITSRFLYIPGLLHGTRFRLAKKLLANKQMQIMMDGNYPEWLTYRDKEVRYAIKNVDIFSCNSDEAHRLTGAVKPEKAIRILGELCPVCIIKHGAKGAYAIQNGSIEYVPGISVKPIDTTGAGDCFNAGFIKGWLEGKPLQECLKWANIVGGLSTLGRGGSEKKVTIKDVEKFLRQYRN